MFSSMQRHVYDRYVVAVCCSVQQCVAVCLYCIYFKCTKTCELDIRCCSVLWCVAVRCGVLQCVAVCCSMSAFYVFQYAET